MAERVRPGGFLLAVHRSPKANRAADRIVRDLIAEGRLEARRWAVEDLELEEHEDPYNLGFVVRVGALDGRHPAAGARVAQRPARVIRSSGRFLVDGGDPLRQVPLHPDGPTN